MIVLWKILVLKMCKRNAIIITHLGHSYQTKSNKCDKIKCREDRPKHQTHYFAQNTYKKEIILLGYHKPIVEFTVVIIGMYIKRKSCIEN